MTDLDGCNRTIHLDEVSKAFHAGDELVVPEGEIANGAAPSRVHFGAFNECQTGAAGSEPADVHEMPVGGEAMVCRILVHRGDANPVFHRDAADGQRLEQ